MSLYTYSSSPADYHKFSVYMYSCTMYMYMVSSVHYLEVSVHYLDMYSTAYKELNIRVLTLTCTHSIVIHVGKGLVSLIPRPFVGGRREKKWAGNSLCMCQNVLVNPSTS